MSDMKRREFIALLGAASGHPAAPPSSVMNARRLMGLTPRPEITG